MKKFINSLLIVSFLTVAASAFAEDVYVTGKGKKFHKEICRVTKNREVQKLDRNEAIGQGLNPCKRCFGKDEAASISGPIELRTETGSQKNKVKS